ncbi:class I SAM-dependent methyltransferase [Methylopila turkensis]|uniref:SAM-dependent methyltransferase n=1 Tax=Methylopila turkensis TaxID=1437816 RepID=A0A9W6N807_9HYPH|nr:SAM-dependent methyltransferase [Methylopila turkensis]GLK80921.1 SAM-dependent methyltransferase [Methylopila turkensis]
MNATTTFDGLTFIREWLTAPLRVGAILPSGATLARAMTAEIDRSVGAVIELGPGTGVFTQALLERGVPEHRLALIETGSEFATLLQLRFPEARTLWMDASALRQVALFDGEKAGAVVSGLPLLSMKPRKVIAILDGAFSHLKPGGAFYQFTYGPNCPVPRPILDRLGLKASRVGRALANMPPATVYRIQRRAPRRPGGEG